MLKKSKLLMILLSVVTLLLSVPVGCKNNTGKDTSKVVSTEKEVISEGRAKGFVALSKEDKEYFGAIQKDALFVPETHYSNNDKTVCIANVVQYGAVGDGVTDDFDAFHNAIRAASDHGGGTVFVPEGAYYISQSLVIPKGVLLRGEYDTPETSGYGGGTNILTDVDTTGIYSTPFITLSSNSGVRNLAFYYLNQNFENPLDLAPCIGFAEGTRSVYATIENIMVYNSTYPFYFGTGHSGTEMNNLWATPLKIGMLSDNNGDVTCFVNTFMDEQYYANCGFVGAPQNDSDRKKLRETLQKATSYIFERHDTAYVDTIYSYGIGTGLIVRESSHPRRTTWSTSGGFAGGCSLYNFEFTGCHTGIEVREVLVGASFIKGRIEVNDAPNSAGIRIDKVFDRYITVDNITIEGKPNVAFLNECTDGNIQVMNCKFQNWMNYGVVSSAGHLHLVNNTFAKSGNGIKADNSVALGVVGCSFAGSPKISTAGIEQGNYLFSAQPMTEMMDPPTQTYDFMTEKPSAAKFDIFNAADYGIDEFGVDDCTEALNKALSDAGANGGGIVYVPAGVYRLDGTLYVPEGVELRGVFETIHSNMDSLKDTVFYVYGGKGQSKGDGAVVLSKNSGVLGLTFYYPEQNVEGFKEGEEYIPFPYTITAKGPGCWVMFTTCANSYNMLDFGSAKDCSNYVIYGAKGQPIRTGVFGGSNSGTGRVERCNFSLAEWTYGSLPYKPYFGAGTYDAAGLKTNELWKAYVYDLLENSDYYVFGYNKELRVYGNLAYSTRHGQRYIAQNGKYTENAKVFYHCMDVTGLSVKIEKAGKLYFVYAFADCELSKDCGATVNSYGTTVNTVFEKSFTVHGGTLNVSSASSSMIYPVFLEVTGGKANLTGGLLTNTPEILVKATGGETSVNGMVVRKRRGLLVDTDAFIIKKSGSAVVKLNGCMSTNRL